MLIRRYHAEDCPVLLDLFRDTIMRVNCRDYSPEQVQVWAGCANPERWEKTLAEHVTLVAEIDGVIVGFGDIDPERVISTGCMSTQITSGWELRPHYVTGWNRFPRPVRYFRKSRSPLNHSSVHAGTGLYAASRSNGWVYCCRMR